MTGGMIGPPVDAAASIASLDRTLITVNDLSTVRTVILFFLFLALIRFILDRERNNPHIMLTLTILYFIIP